MAKIRERPQRMMSSTQVEVVNPSDPSVSWEMLSKDILSTKLLWRSIGPVAPGGMGVSQQGCISCGTCSYLELTEDHVLTSAYVEIFRIVTRNAVNKSF